MKERHCKFQLFKVSVGEVDLFLSFNDDKPSGIDDLDGKLLRMIGMAIESSICHIFNLSPEEGVCPQAWREAKVMLLPKSGRSDFTGSNSRPCQLLVSCWKKWCLTKYNAISL
jgi:hypothetical protein